MNERIKDLADQAGFKVNWQHEDVQAIKMARLEKFTELIVNECISYCGENLSKTVGGALKIHLGVDKFGIEERTNSRTC